jgi:hypothetical protein
VAPSKAKDSATQLPARLEPIALHCTFAGGANAWPPVPSWQTMRLKFWPAVALASVDEFTSPVRVSFSVFLGWRRIRAWRKTALCTGRMTLPIQRGPVDPGHLAGLADLADRATPATQSHR